MHTDRIHFNHCLVIPETDTPSLFIHFPIDGKMLPHVVLHMFFRSQVDASGRSAFQTGVCNPLGGSENNSISCEIKWIENKGAHCT